MKALAIAWVMFVGVAMAMLGIWNIIEIPGHQLMAVFMFMLSGASFFLGILLTKDYR